MTTYSKQDPNDVIDLTDDSERDADNNGIGESEALDRSKPAKKRKLDGSSSKQPPPDAEVIDLSDECPASVTVQWSPPTAKAKAVEDAKHNKKRPRDSLFQDTHSLVSNVEVINDKYSGNRDQSGKSFNGRGGSSQNGITTTGRNLHSVKQKVVLEPDDNAILTRGVFERIHTLSMLSRNKCWTCLGSNRNVEPGENRNPVFGAPVHIRQPDSWSCGYRNFQMLLSALLPRLQNSPGHPVFQKLARRLPPTPISLPSVLQIQASMEDAWENEGFDPEGANHYHKQIFNKTGKDANIGAVEVANIFWYHGIDATFMQFIEVRESRQLLPFVVWSYFTRSIVGNKVEAASLAYSLMTEATRWSKLPFMEVEKLAETASRANTKNQNGMETPPLLPLYLQWVGHSVTVVGIEVSGNQKATSLSSPSALSAKLLVLDPGKDVQKPQANPNSGGSNHSMPSTFTLSWDQISNKELQIIVCTERSMTFEERESCKSQNGTNIVPPRGRSLTAARDAVSRYYNAR